MSVRGTTLAQAFSNKLMLEMYDGDLLDTIVNRDYEGEINEVGSVLNMMNFDRISEQTYANVALSPDSLGENNAKLIIDQYKSFYFKIKTLANWLSYIKDPKPTVITQTASERRKNMDTFVFSLWGKVGAGHWSGTDYSDGDVTVDVTTGQVTGNGTTFTSGMVGKGFKATGHSVHYRVKTFNSTTDIVIEDDLDDVDSQYTGGAIAGGTAYSIQANTAVQVTASNILQKIIDIKLFLDEAEASGYNSVSDDRWMVLPPSIALLIPTATGVALHVPQVYEELVKKGMITMLVGFKIFQSNRLAGNKTDGFRVLAGSKAWMTFAEKVLEVEAEEFLRGDFGSAYKDLFVYGAKVTDSRRHQAVGGYWKL